MAKRRKKKKSHRLYAFIVIFLAFAILAMTVVLLFYIQNIDVKGNEYTEDKVILESVQNDKLSVNSLYLLAKYRFMKYEVPKSLNSVKIRMINPWTVRVIVEEKAIIGCCMEDDTYIYFDKEGTVVLKEEAKREGVPYIEGVSIEKPDLYKKMKMEDKKLLSAVLNVAQDVKKFELSPDQILCTESGIELYFGSVRVILGKNVTTKKMAQIAPILAKLEGRAGTLHLEHFEDESSTIPFKEDPPAVEEGTDDGSEDGSYDYEDDSYDDYFDGYDYDEDYGYDYDDDYSYDYDEDYSYDYDEDYSYDYDDDYSYE